MDSTAVSVYSKKKCQYFSPLSTVQELLDYSDFRKNIFGKKILENSFGEGNILLPIVERYIKDAKKKQIDVQTIKNALEEDIYGFEIDSDVYSNCIGKLNRLIQEYGIYDVTWKNLVQGDFLTYDETTKFDFIICNPPYIDYRNLDNIELRAKLKDEFISCSEGKFDFCYPFIEKSIRLLSENGIFSAIIPINIYKNKFAYNLRKIMKSGTQKIIVYPSQRIFPEALTSTSIFVYKNNNDSDFFSFKNATTQKSFELERNSLNNEKWIFNLSNSNDTKKDSTFTKFGDIFSVSMVIATLCNKAFIVNEETVENENLEAEIVRPAASPHAFKAKTKEYIIFPYSYDKNDCLIRFSEAEFSKMFPNVSEHLMHYKTDLDNRKSDKNCKWFEYGRSQAIKKMHQRKLIISTVVTNKIFGYILDENTIPYAGIMICAKSKEYTLEDAKKILSGKDFLDYVELVGTNVNNNSIRISSKDIENYPIP